MGRLSLIPSNIQRLFCIPIGCIFYGMVRNTLHTSYATLSSGILWNIPRITCIFSVFSIFQLPIIHLVCPPKFCINYCFRNMQSSQENSKTIVYAKFGGQTRCIMGNWKIENTHEPLGECVYEENISDKWDIP